MGKLTKSGFSARVAVVVVINILPGPRCARVLISELFKWVFCIAFSRNIKESSHTLITRWLCMAVAEIMRVVAVRNWLHIVGSRKCHWITR